MAKRKGLPAVYYPKKKSEVPAYYNSFATKLPTFQAKYGLVAADVTKIGTNGTQIITLAGQQQADIQKAQQSTRLYDEKLISSEIDAKRVINFMIEHPSFILSDGEALGFIKVKEPVDYSKVKPSVTDILSENDMVIIEWLRGNMQGVIIYSNDGVVEGSIDNIKWIEIGRDLRSPYEDMRKNREVRPETRFYRLRYMRNDKPVGLYSDIVNVIAEIY